MAQSGPAKALWHDLDRVLRQALGAGASWDEAISALRDKADHIERLRDSGCDPANFRKFERI